MGRAVLLLVCVVSYVGCCHNEPILLSEVGDKMDPRWSIRPEPESSAFSPGSFEDMAFHAKGADYAHVPSAIDIKRVRVSATEREYIFEIHTDGDVKALLEQYGAAAQFTIFTEASGRRLFIFTTDILGEAVVLTAPGGTIRLRLRKDDTVESVDEIWPETTKEKARLKIEFGEKSFTVKLPKALFASLTEEDMSTGGADWVKYSDIKPVEERPQISWRVSSGIALPPVKPITGSIPHVYYVPELDTCSSREGFSFGVRSIWIDRQNDK